MELIKISLEVLWIAAVCFSYFLVWGSIVTADMDDTSFWWSMIHGLLLLGGIVWLFTR